MDNTTITNENYNIVVEKGGNLFLENVENIIIINSNLSNGKSFDKGGGLYIFNSEKLLLQNNTF